MAVGLSVFPENRELLLFKASFKNRPCTFKMFASITVNTEKKQLA